MLEETILKLVHETKRVADRLEMIHNHLVKLPEKDPQLDAKLIKEEIKVKQPIHQPRIKTDDYLSELGKDALPISKKKPALKAEDIDIIEEEIEQEIEELEELEPTTKSGELSADELSGKCKQLLEAGKDKEARARIRVLFVEVLKNTFGVEKTSELEPKNRQVFYDILEKRVRGK